MLNKELRKMKIGGRISVRSLKGGLGLIYIKNGIQYSFFFPWKVEEAYENWVACVIDPKEIIDYISKQIDKINTYTG